MAININREKLLTSFPDPAYEFVWRNPAEVAASKNYVVTYILSNACSEERVMNVIEIKPLLSFLRYNDFSIARIACGIAGGEKFPDNVLRVAADAVREMLPQGKTLNDLDKKQMLAVAKVFRNVLKSMREESNVLRDVLSKIVESPSTEPETAGATPSEKSGPSKS